MSDIFVVQTFREEGGSLAADLPHRLRREKDALALARRLSPLKAGVIAASMSSGVSGGHAGAPIVLYRAGKVPPKWRRSLARQVRKPSGGEGPRPEPNVTG